MSQLREGPLGRLLPNEKGEEGGETASAEPDEHSTYGGTPAKDDKEKKGILDSSREAFENLGKTIDERVRSALTSFSPFQQLQAEVVKLRERIEELESKLESERKTKGKKD
jgi:hypothetical protein